MLTMLRPHNKTSKDGAERSDSHLSRESRIINLQVGSNSSSRGAASELGDGRRSRRSSVAATDKSPKAHSKGAKSAAGKGGKSGGKSKKQLKKVATGQSKGKGRKSNLRTKKTTQVAGATADTMMNTFSRKSS